MIELYLQWRTTRKSHMVYRTVPFSITLTLTLGLGLGSGYEKLGNRTQTFKWYHFQ